MTGISPAIVRRLAARARWSVVPLLMAAASPLAAHPAYLTSAVATIQRDGQFQIRVRFDTLAFALNDTSDRMPDPPMNALLDGPRTELERRMAAARVHFARHFELESNGRPVPIAALHFPTADDVLAWKAENHQPRLPVLLSAEMSGQLPADTTRISFRFPEIIGTIVLAVERPGEETWTGPVEPGALSHELAVTLSSRDGGSTMPAAAASSWGWLQTLGRFVVLGFEHIVPRGMDHVLFVLGLFLLGTRLSTLLWQVTAFTVAHSVSLGLSLYGVVRLPSSVVEPLIAFSIVLVAVDNLRSAGLRWWRLPVVFVFGLVHGMGFAGALLDLGVSRHDFPPMLVGFNLGVELGQLAVIAAAFALVGWLRSRSDYRRLVVIPGSVAIGCIALIWTIARIGVALKAI